MQGGFSLFGSQSKPVSQSTTSIAPGVDLSRSTTSNFGTAPLGGSELDLSQLNTSKPQFGFGAPATFGSSFTTQGNTAPAFSVGVAEVTSSRNDLLKLKQCFKEFADTAAQHIAAFSIRYKELYDMDIGLHKLRDEIKATRKRIELISENQLKTLKSLQEFAAGAEAVSEMLGETEKRDTAPKNEQMLFTVLTDKMSIFEEGVAELVKRFPGGQEVADIFCTLAGQMDLCLWINQFVSV